MRLFRKRMYHCQSCVFGNNEKGKFIKTILRNSLYYCEERGYEQDIYFGKIENIGIFFVRRKKNIFHGIDINDVLSE